MSFNHTHSDDITRIEMTLKGHIVLLYDFIFIPSILSNAKQGNSFPSSTVPDDHDEDAHHLGALGV